MIDMKFLGKSVEKGIDWLSTAAGGFFETITVIVDALVETLQSILLFPHPIVMMVIIAALAYYAAAKNYKLFTREGWKAGSFLGLFTFFGLLVLERSILLYIVDTVVIEFDYWYIIALALVILIPGIKYYKKAKKPGLFTKSGFVAAGKFKYPIQFVVLLLLFLFLSKAYLGLIVMQQSYWEDTMLTLALVVSSALLALVIGIPLGIWASRSDRVAETVRPILDFMQTMPPFVYLIPAILFFSVGNVPGVVATVVFSLPPGVRLTNLGIRGVQPNVVEAARSFGSSDRQLLYKVQLPLAKPTIMAGVNQVIMLALSMVVIASMVGAAGLGQAVYKGILTADVALGFEAGLGLVLVAILLDRISQQLGGVAKKNEE